MMLSKSLLYGDVIGSKKKEIYFTDFGVATTYILYHIISPHTINYDKICEYKSRYIHPSPNIKFYPT